MRLISGAEAPSFVTEDATGKRVALADYRGRRVLLSFFRNARCALCNLRVHHLIQRFDQFQSAGLVVLAVFESPAESLVQHVARQEVPFPLVADPTARLYELYGVESSPEKVAAVVQQEPGWLKPLIAEAQSIGYDLVPEPGSNFARLPADFLIGPDGRIVTAFYSEAPGQHLPWESLES